VVAAASRPRGAADRGQRGEVAGAVAVSSEDRQKREPVMEQKRPTAEHKFGRLARR
jgi:hypothetical protein